MLEKDKNCIEFSMRSMMATHKPYQEDTEIAITGMAPGKSLLFAVNPFDIPCDVVVVSKRYFERLQADDQHYREMAKQWEENYNLLLKKTGFDTVESLVFYLTNVGCDTLLEALASYISERDKTSEKFEKEIQTYSRALKEWKEGTGCPSPSAVKSLLEHYLDENKKLQKNIDELRDDISGRSTVIESDKREIERLRGVLRRSNSVMLKTLYQEINIWQKATGCSTPEEAEKKIKLLVDDINVLMRVTED